MVVWCGIGAEDNLQAESNTLKPIYFSNQMVPRYRLVFCSQFNMSNHLVL